MHRLIFNFIEFQQHLNFTLSIGGSRGALGTHSPSLSNFSISCSFRGQIAKTKDGPRLGNSGSSTTEYLQPYKI